ncbi:MAG: hypothetical protein PHP86_16615 [Nevskiales bacterium]|nr:hypothetical protein [Nevskiales bacterium]
MRLVLLASAALASVFATTEALAQLESPQDCKVYVDQQWVDLGNDSLNDCLIGLETNVDQYDAQGFKFGAWGETVLSADRHYFYRSNDGGKNWQALGLKAEMPVRAQAAPAATATTTASAPIEPAPLAEPQPQPRVEPRAEPATPVTTTAAKQPAVLHAAGSEAIAGDPVPAERTTRHAVPAPVAESTADASTAPTGPATGAVVASTRSVDRRPCSIKIGGEWSVVGATTLEGCASKLDKSPDTYDSNGFKYAYWAGVYLVADRKLVQKSADKTKGWTVVLERGAP